MSDVVLEKVVEIKHEINDSEILCDENCFFWKDIGDPWCEGCFLDLHYGFDPEEGHIRKPSERCWGAGKYQLTITRVEDTE